MKAHPFWIGVVIAVSAAAAGCSHSSRPVYSGPTGTATAVPVSEQRGRVVSVRDVEIRDTPPRTSSTGGTLGQAVGIALGSVTAIAGAVGDVVDAAKSGGRPGEEITILLDDGRTVMIVQERADPPFAPDERVIIQKGVATSTGGSTRVVRDDRVVEPRPRTERLRFGSMEPRFSQ